MLTEDRALRIAKQARIFRTPNSEDLEFKVDKPHVKQERIRFM